MLLAGLPYSLVWEGKGKKVSGHLPDRQTDSQKATQVDRQTDRQKGSQADKHTDRLTDRQKASQTDRQTDRKLVR